MLKKKCAIEIWFKSQANNLYMLGVNGVLEVAIGSVSILAAGSR